MPLPKKSDDKISDDQISGDKLMEEVDTMMAVSFVFIVKIFFK